MAATLSLDALAQKMYKWIDEKGVVHYTDKLPPDAVDKANTEFNRQGIQIKKTDRATTPEQRREREVEEERKKLDAREKQEVTRRDRALLDSYTTEEDIDLARNRALKTVDLAVQSAQAYIAQLTKRKEGVLAKKAEAADKPATVAANERELARIESDLGRQNELVARKRTEMTALREKYESDKERWRAAKSRIGTAAAPIPGPSTPTQAGKAQK